MNTRNNVIYVQIGAEIFVFDLLVAERFLTHVFRHLAQDRQLRQVKSDRIDKSEGKIPLLVCLEIIESKISE